MAVIAIGGYGRKELNPQSDIDIQFLCDDQLWRGAKPHEYLQSVTDTVLYMLWDLGLKIGHSVRRVQLILLEMCIHNARSKINHFSKCFF